ncbi:MAG TPA: acetate--CoA ligase family protein [Smithellaceae bacterium]|nr:acetate--CoA ligase family protein [Smithellaceae bacterium]
MVDKASSDINLSSLDSFFNPASIALIGVSRDIRRPTGRSLNALLKWNYPGKLYPINPNHTEIHGLTCYPTLLDVPGDVDMVIISVPASSVLAALEQCVQKKVKAVVLFTSGFAEIGAEGKALQDQVTHLSRKNNLRILGPNCVGLVNLSNSVIASFANIVDLKPVYPMTLGFVTQSGAFGTLIFATAVAAGVGFSSFVSVGNEADTEFADFLYYLLNTEKTKVVGGYLEGAKNGAKLRRAAEQALKLKKPILIMKVGRTGAGARAASSHTGSLAGDDKIYDAFFRQMGIIRIETLSELTSFVIVHRSGRLPRGNNIGILSISGGAGVLMADKCESLGLHVPEFTGETRRVLEQYLPPFGSAKNPVDLTSAAVAQPEMLGNCLRALVADENIHMINVAMGFVPHNAPILAKDLIDVYQSTTKPIVLVTYNVSESEVTAKAVKSIEEAGMPVLQDHLHSVQALSNLAWYASRLRRPVEIKADRYTFKLEKEIEELIKKGGALSEHEAKKILAAYGIPVTREKIATTADQAVKVARKIGYPVTLKISSAQIRHKTEAGGIRLNIKTDAQVRVAFRQIIASAKKYMSQAEIQGVLVQEMLQGGTEVIVGTVDDSVFGPCVMFGLGGVFVEALKDVSFRVAPLSRLDAEEMISDIQGYSILRGLRGKPPVNTEALIDIILKVSRLASDHKNTIKELDINPLILFKKDAKVADALIIKK